MARQFRPGQLQTGSLYNISSSYAITASYVSNAGTSVNTGSFVTTSSFNAFTASYTTGSFTGSFAGTFTGTASYATQALSASYASTASYVVTAQTASYVLNAVSSSFATTASYYNETDPIFVAKSGSFATTGSNTFIGTQTITGSNGRLIYRGTTPGVYPENTLAEIHANDDYPWLERFYNDTFSTSSAIMAYFGWSDGRFVFHNESTQSIGLQVNGFGAENGLLVYSDKVAFVNNVEVTGSLNVVGGITGSLFGTASYAQSASQATNANTASNILGGSINHIPYFVTNTTLSSSAIYQSGSTSIIINQSNATTANPEALYVWQPSTSSINVISGKGNLDNYLQLNIQNTNQGISASSDVVATANNGNEITNYIDMGINSENYNTGFIGGVNDAYLYSTGRHLHIGNASNFPVQIFAGGSDVDIHNKLELNPNNQHRMSGSLDVSGSIKAFSFTGSLQGTASYATAALTASHALYAADSNLLDGKDSSIFATTGSNTFIGNQTVTGSLFTSGSNTLIGTTQLTGSFNVSGSQAIKGYIEFQPVTTNINTALSASYIYVSGSTNDLYFSQNGDGYSNVTRLRWLEGNLYTGLLNGGIITQVNSNTYQVSSGSGIIVNMNASYSANPYPIIQYLNWGNLTKTIDALSGSYDQQFVSIDNTTNIFAQGTPYTNGQYNTLIPLGIVLHQNKSTINGVQTFPGVAYGWKQRSFDFIKSFGPLKISGYNLAPSGSSTGSLVLTGGVAWVDGRNYTIDPNEPSYIVEPSGITTSKIFRYYQSGSDFVYNTNAGAGFASIDPANYSNNGTLTPVASNDWSIQRVFYFPNSATKALFVYYGNATYPNEAAALAAVTTEPFSEAANTTANAIYVGYMLLRNNADFTVPSSYEFYASGLFRGSGASVTSGGGGSTALIGLSDVSIISPTNGQPLVYNSSTLKWQNSSTVIANLTGNASTATSASYSTTASYSQTAVSSSYALTASFALNGGGGGGSAFPYTGSAVITGSLIVTGSVTATDGFTGSLYGTATSSSYATSASYANVAQTLLGSVITAETASYATNFTVGSTLNIDGTLFDRATVNSTIVGSNNLFTQATGSYTSAFGKYTLHNGANARAGEFNTVWNGTTAVSTETSTTDIGNTADITFTSAIISSNIQINAVAATSGWTVKMLVTYI